MMHREYHGQRGMRLRVVVAVATLLLAAGLVSAHQPRFPSAGTTLVKKPEISQAYYAELKGAPDFYCIDSEDSFRLYVQLVVPDIPGVEKDYVADITFGQDTTERHLAQLRGDSAEWTSFFDPFGGDNYFQGPEYETPVTGGSYHIKVSSPDNLGKYLLVVGTKESFPPAEIARVTCLLPSLKRNYFGKPACCAYWNYTGLFLGGTAVVVAGIITGAVLLARR